MAYWICGIHSYCGSSTYWERGTLKTQGTIFYIQLLTKHGCLFLQQKHMNSDRKFYHSIYFTRSLRDFCSFLFGLMLGSLLKTVLQPKTFYILWIKLKSCLFGIPIISANLHAYVLFVFLLFFLISGVRGKNKINLSILTTTQIFKD